MDDTPVAGTGTRGGPAHPLVTPADRINSPEVDSDSLLCQCVTRTQSGAGNVMSQYMVLFLVGLVRLYQKTAPFRPAVCRFHPTCSRYTIDALHKYGVMRGLWRAIKRLSKCHPFHEGGYDPVL